MLALAVCLAALASPSLHAASATPPAPYVDLHAHLFMDRGMGPLFIGSFRGPIRATRWSDRFSSQINEDTLESSGIGLMVAALYAHPILEPDRRESIRRQLADARAFVATHADWVIARTPAEARAGVAAGRRVLVLSLENAGGILESESDLREFVDGDGISIVTLAHLTDSDLSGAALMPGYHVLGNPLAMAGSWLEPESSDGARLNPRGLSPRGRDIASALIARRVWLDLTHSPEATLAELVPMLREAGQPLLFTHVGMRDYERAEREISDSRLDEVRETGGIVGLLPDESIVGATPSAPAAGAACRGGVYALAAQFDALAAKIGDSHVFLGSDFSGMSLHLKPVRGCPTGTSLDARGFYHIGQTPELWATLARSGARAHEATTNAIENFISTWARIRGE
jgi:microsomal dipeptidase-like Zn-dependent dipeptidase